MKVNRWTLGRRAMQLAVLGLLLSPLWSRTVFEGTLASAALFGLQLSDPLATLQLLLLTGSLPLAMLTGSGLILTVYGLLGGRVFCGWVCPVHLLTDLAEYLPGVRQRPYRGLAGKFVALGVTALLSLLFAVPAFETVSPIGVAVRSLTFGAGSGLLLLVLIVLVEMFWVRRLWCRSLCPLGAVYALLGRISPLKVTYAPERCIHCDRCSQVCFVPEVLVPSLDQAATRVSSGECSRCGACIGVCPTTALSFNCLHQPQPSQEVLR